MVARIVSVTLFGVELLLAGVPTGVGSARSSACGMRNSAFNCRLVYILDNLFLALRLSLRKRCTYQLFSRVLQPMHADLVDGNATQQVEVIEKLSGA
jgi:hypothetical protein